MDTAAFINDHVTRTIRKQSSIQLFYSNTLTGRTLYSIFKILFSVRVTGIQSQRDFIVEGSILSFSISP